MKGLMRKYKLLSNCSGQTMVEYILLILVVVVIIQSVFVKLNDFIISNPNSLQNKYLQGYTSIFSAGADGVDGNFKRFRLIR